MELAGLISVTVLLILTAAFFWLAGADNARRRLEWEGYSLGIQPQSLLVPAIEAELARSRRFGRGFALVIANSDALHRRFTLRQTKDQQAAAIATAELLSQTRERVDRVFRYGPNGFALLLPESEPAAVEGMIRRLRSLGRSEPLQDVVSASALFFGATFYPSCSTTVEGLLKRGELSLRLARASAARLHLDGARAAEEQPVDTLRAIG